MCPLSTPEAKGIDPDWSAWKRELHFAPWMGIEKLGPAIVAGNSEFMIAERMDGDVLDLAQKQAKSYFTANPRLLPGSHTFQNTILLTRIQMRHLLTLVDRLSRFGIVLGDLKLENIGYLLDPEDPQDFDLVQFRIFDFGFA